MSYIGRQGGLATRNVYKFSCTSTATTLSGQDVYGRTLSMPTAVDLVSIFFNGVLIIGRGTDYSITQTTVTFTSAYANGDEIIIITLEPFAIADMVKASTGGTFEGGVTVNGAFTSKGINDDASLETLKVETDNVTVQGVHPDLTIKDTDDGNNYGGLFYNNGVLSVATDHTNAVANSAVVFLTDGTERARFNTAGNLAFVSGKGIDFSATSDGSGSNQDEILEDYEDGEWNATLTPQTSGSVGMSNDGCQYVKVGQIVHVSGIVQVNSVSSPVGVMRMGGLPFACANKNDLGGGSLATINIQAAAIPPYRYGMWLQEGDSHADIFDFTTSSDQPQSTASNNFGGNESIYFSMTYRTA